MKVQSMMKPSLTAAALALVFAAGCGQADPMLHAVTVSPATVAAGEDLTLTVDLENFDLVNPDGHAHGLRAADESHEHGEADGDYPSEGHFHVYMDSVEQNPLMINCPDHCMHSAFAKEVRARIPDGTAAGMHTIIVRLNDNSHMTLTPHIKAEATFTVQ
ncbi:MAG: hypothetical protein RIU46_19765 [Deltaproteobacteria bacterium]|jgi:hypothetical protein